MRGRLIFAVALLGMLPSLRAQPTTFNFSNPFGAFEAWPISGNDGCRSGVLSPTGGVGTISLQFSFTCTLNTVTQTMAGTIALTVPNQTLVADPMLGYPL